LGFLVLALVAFPSSASAQVTGAEAACRYAMAQTAAKYVKTLQKVIVSCHRSRNRGSIDALTDCNDGASADTRGKAAKAATKLRDKVTTRCSATPAVLAEFARCPSPHQTLDDAGPTTGIDDLEELLDCQVAHLEHAVESMTETALGLPEGELTSEQQKCHATIAKQLTRVVDTTSKVRAKCQKALDRSGGPLDFACATEDPLGKIADASAGAIEDITDACGNDEAVAGLALGACKNSPELPRCLVEDVADPSAGSIAAMPWGWRGFCPASAELFIAGEPPFVDADFGWDGNGHDAYFSRPLEPFTYSISCDEDCANCVSTGVDFADQACRCKDDQAFECTNDNDCAAAGGECWCYLNPPTHINAGGLPLCLTMRAAGDLEGSYDPATGDTSLSAPLYLQTYVGISQLQPCPVCSGNICDGGARDGMACIFDGLDSTFGRVSYDCPPSPLAVVAGGPGQQMKLELTTGAFSLPFNVPCDPPLGALKCACSTCSLDNDIPCNSNADCSAVGGGELPHRRVARRSPAKSERLRRVELQHGTRRRRRRRNLSGLERILLFPGVAFRRTRHSPLLDQRRL
jgi:hypothetical protein